MSITLLRGMSEEQRTALREQLECGSRRNGECWEWTGAKNHCGYGVIKKLFVHRLAYALFVHDFSKSDFICHHCDNPRCYNPAHLYVGNSKTNGADAASRRRYKTSSIYKKAKEPRP